MATSERGLAVLHGYDPETGKTTSDPFTERAVDVGHTSPWHRADTLRTSVRDDFPGWLWSIGLNERARSLMADENMRRLGLAPTPDGDTDRRTHDQESTR